MTNDRRRTELGGAASAALPLLWDFAWRHGLSDAQLADSLGIDSGKLARLVYGDRRPGRRLAAALWERVGIPLSAWDEPCPARRRRHGSSQSTPPPSKRCA